MKTRISFIPASEVLPIKEDDICGKCRMLGLNLCAYDEVCQIRLAKALGKPREEIDATLDEAKRKGLIKVRETKLRGDRPRRFIKITEKGKLFFALLK